MISYLSVHKSVYDKQQLYIDHSFMDKYVLWGENIFTKLLGHFQFGRIEACIDMQWRTLCLCGCVSIIPVSAASSLQLYWKMCNIYIYICILIQWGVVCWALSWGAHIWWGRPLPKGSLMLPSVWMSWSSQKMWTLSWVLCELTSMREDARCVSECLLFIIFFLVLFRALKFSTILPGWAVLLSMVLKGAHAPPYKVLLCITWERREEGKRKCSKTSK